MQRMNNFVPKNEPFLNPKDHPDEWKKFEKGMKKIPKGIDIPMIINGERVYSKTKLDDLNPATGEVLATLQQSDESDAKRAIEAALAAKKSWAEISPNFRIQKFRDLEKVLLSWKYETCAVAMIENGYNAYETYVEWAELIDFIRFNNYYYASLLDEAPGPSDTETNSIQLRPLKGFTCAVTPFNFPQAIGFNLPLVMALTGNTVVWKPSADTTLSAYILMLALEEAGFPKGVINMVTGHGRPCLKPILTHPELMALNFTGSFATAHAFGRYLYSEDYRRQNFPRFVAETGGKNFLLADEDIDVRDTAISILQAGFGRSGQKCSANSVVLVNEKIWPELKKVLVAEAKKLKLTNPTDPDCDVGPVINEDQFDKITGFISRAMEDSQCDILVGGKFSKEKGFYVHPTLIEVHVDKHELLRDEIFGPVTAVRTFKTMDEAIELIEQHDYRLTGSVVSRNEAFLNQYVPILSQYAGNFYVNRKTTGAIVYQQPFGGDGASGTNGKAGSRWYLWNFISPGTVTRRHIRATTPELFSLMGQQ